MADSRRVLHGNQNRYRNAALDATLGREAHRERGATQTARVASNANAAMAARTMMGSREGHAETRVSPAPREAHFESAAERATPRGTVSADRLQRLGALLQRDENLARKLAKNPRRALASLDFISERDKQILAGIDPQFWSQVAAVSDNFNVAAGKRAMAGLADAPLSIDGGTGYGSGGGTPYGWGGIGPPQGRGVGVGNGVFVHPGGRGGSGQGAEGDEGGGLGITDYGFGHGNAGAPSVGGHRVGVTGAGSGSGGSRFSDPLGYGAIGMHGDGPGGGGISGGSLPSRAVLAGSAWKALHPGRDASDDPSDNKSEKDKLAASADQDTLLGSMLSGVEVGGTAGGLVGATLGGAVGSAANGGIGTLLGMFIGGADGAAVGATVGALGGAAGYLWRHYQPADTDLTGGSGGVAGPRAAASSRTAAIGNEAIPNDYGTGTGSGGGPRSNVRQRGQNSFGTEAIPNDFGSGTSGVGPRSRGSTQGWQSRSGVEAIPNDQGTGGTGPVGPSSRG